MKEKTNKILSFFTLFILILILFGFSSCILNEAENENEIYYIFQARDYRTNEPLKYIYDLYCDRGTYLFGEYYAQPDLKILSDDSGRIYITDSIISDWDLLTVRNEKHGKYGPLSKIEKYRHLSSNECKDVLLIRNDSILKYVKDENVIFLDKDTFCMGDYFNAFLKSSDSLCCFWSQSCDSLDSIILPVYVLPGDKYLGWAINNSISFGDETWEFMTKIDTSSIQINGYENISEGKNTRAYFDNTSVLNPAIVDGNFIAATDFSNVEMKEICIDMYEDYDKIDAIVFYNFACWGDTLELYFESDSSQLGEPLIKVNPGGRDYYFSGLNESGRYLIIKTNQRIISVAEIAIFRNTL